MRTLLAKLADRLRKQPTPPPPQIHLTEEGFDIVRNGETMESLRWRNVRKIVTFKYDNVSHDEICVAFLVDEENSWILISEEWNGFLKATEKMKERFPSISENWFTKVMTPVFETKKTVLFELS
jgi:hypothetical protein